MDAIKLTRKQAAPIIKAAAPEYTGRKITVRFASAITLYDLNWSGGTRNQYTILDASQGIGKLTVPAPWAHTGEGQIVALSADRIVVEHTIFCGSDLGLTIWAHPQYCPKWLTA